MEQLVYITHAGLRVILQVVRSTEQAHGRLALCVLSPDVLGAFQASGLTTLVDIYSSRADAIAATSITVALTLGRIGL